MFSFWGFPPLGLGATRDFIFICWLGCSFEVTFDSAILGFPDNLIFNSSVFDNYAFSSEVAAAILFGLTDYCPDGFLISGTFLGLGAGFLGISSSITYFFFASSLLLCLAYYYSGAFLGGTVWGGGVGGAYYFFLAFSCISFESEAAIFIIKDDSSWALSSSPDATIRTWSLSY
jgi:hypothetical protein